MDFETFRVDLTTEARKLPIELLQTLQRLATYFGPGLEQHLPKMIENLKPHIQTIMMEMAMGVMDKEGLERTIMGVLTDVLNAKAA
jgi:hypothetical protein